MTSELKSLQEEISRVEAQATKLDEKRVWSKYSNLLGRRGLHFVRFSAQSVLVRRVILLVPHRLNISQDEGLPPWRRLDKVNHARPYHPDFRMNLNFVE
jgi:hypothetical protein